MKHRLKKLLNPKVLIPTLLSVALLAFILAFANAGQVLGDIVLVTGLLLFKHRLIRRRLSDWQPRWKWLCPLRDGLKQFLEGSEQLFS